jgi:hypothetical protein
MSQGQWLNLAKTKPIVGTATQTVGTGTAATLVTVTTNDEQVEKWEETNAKALGNICLRLNPSIQYKHRDEFNAEVLWEALKLEYGKPGITATYLEFKHAIETRIPDNADPTAALNKIETHIGRLAQASVIIPDYLHAMIILAKMPPSMDATAQVITIKDDIALLKPEAVKRAVILAYESKTCKKPNQGQHANKLSTVKCNDGEPSFQQQQQ